MKSREVSEVSVMKKITSVIFVFLIVFTLASCNTSSNIKCGAGTVYKDGTCQAPEQDDQTPSDNQDPTDNETPTDNQNPTDNETPVDNTPVNALELIASTDFTSDDISAWVTEGNVELSHDSNGFLIVNVSSFTGEFYQENIQLPDMATEKDHTYTISIIAKTDINIGRDVQFFLEDTNNNFAKYFLETESLTTDFKTFTYTYVSTSDNSDSKLGIFLGSMENAELGNVIINSITVTKQDGLVGTYLEELENPGFDSNDISNWNKEGNVELSHDTNGYLVVNVTDLSVNFWEDNVTYGDLITEAWTNYTVTLRIKSSVERSIVVFAEDTNNGFAKYIEVTQSITTDWTEISISFKPTESNSDTKLGLFLGQMENASIGTIYIDSITIIADSTFE